jgi:NADH dehydrogenase/NADH:ubiquinone oxidoreductase subunit G
LTGEVTLEIDGGFVKAKEGMTILEAAKLAGIEIPTLCHHEGMEPYGACRICVVEIERHGRVRTVASCCYPVEDGLRVRTRTPKINRIRKNILELAAITSGADVGGNVNGLAYAYNADLSRFSSTTSVKPTNCILCGLCVRRCEESQWDNAIDFVGRGTTRCVAFIPGKEGACGTCSSCYGLCPTGRVSSVGPDPPFPLVSDILAGRKKV